MKFRPILIAITLVLSISTIAESAYGLSKPDLESAKSQAISCEQQEIWKQINWADTAQEALVLGKQQNKPIMFVLVVGHHGKKDAAEC